MARRVMGKGVGVKTGAPGPLSEPGDFPPGFWSSNLHMCTHMQVHVCAPTHPQAPCLTAGRVIFPKHKSEHIRAWFITSWWCNPYCTWMAQRGERQQEALSKLPGLYHSWNAGCKWESGDRQGCSHTTSFLIPNFQRRKLRLRSIEKLEAAWLVRGRARTRSQVYLNPNFMLLEPHEPSHCPHCHSPLLSKIPPYFNSCCSLPDMPSYNLSRLKPSSVRATHHHDCFFSGSPS